MIALNHNRLLARAPGLASLCALLVGGAAATAAAQGRDYSGEYDERYSDRQYTVQEGGDRPIVEERLRQIWTDSGLRGEVDEEAAVFIGYDINGDGDFDVYEYISVDNIDLERLAQLKRAGRLISLREWRTRGHGLEPDRDRRYRVEGRLTDMMTVEVGRMKEPHLVGNIETALGMIRTELGPVSRINSLNLKEGDTITVFGREAMINDRRILIATRIVSGDKQVSLLRDRIDTRRRLAGALRRKLEGTVTNVQPKLVNQTGKDHAIAEVRTKRGRVVQVDLGSAQAAQNLNIKVGDNITVVGRIGRIDDRVALLANRVRMGDGEVFTLLRARDDSSPFRQTSYTTGQSSGQRPQ